MAGSSTRRQNNSSSWKVRNKSPRIFEYNSRGKHGPRDTNASYCAAGTSAAPSSSCHTCPRSEQLVAVFVWLSGIGFSNIRLRSAASVCAAPLDDGDAAAAAAPDCDSASQHCTRQSAHRNEHPIRQPNQTAFNFRRYAVLARGVHGRTRRGYIVA